MGNKKYLLGCYIIGIVLLMGLISAASNAHVAYIYKSKTDKNVINLFTSLRLKVDLIKESSLPRDLSMYKFIFIGDENFVKDIPVDEYPSVIINHYLPEKDGLSDEISSLASTMPLQVNFNGDEVTVYNSAKDSRGISIPYYYLDKQNKAAALEQFAGTYKTSSGANFGDVISLGAKGDELLNGDVLQDNLCFFGISETDYWTDEAKALFKDCVKYVFDYTTIPEPVITCTEDSNCSAPQLIGLPFCSNNNVFKNLITFKCKLPGTEESYCANETSAPQLVQTCQLTCSDGKCDEIACNSNNDCDDKNSTTEDVCVNSGTIDSICIHNIDNTYVNLISFVATPSQNSVMLSLSFSFLAASNNNVIIKGYLLSMDRQKWIFVSSPVTSYVFDGLTPSTDYIFYAKAIDNNNITSDEMNISVRTLDVPPVTPPVVIVSSGGGGGGGGGVSYCSAKWQCSGWSECKSGIQTRVCSVPAGICKPEVDKPNEKQSCVETGKALFDIVLTIINPQIILGENLTARISLVNFGNKTNLNVTLNYTITDSKNKIILSEKEIVPVEIQKEFIKEFVLPSQITLGEYKLSVEMDYEGQEEEAVSQGSFEILSGKVTWAGLGKTSYWIIGVSLLVIAGIVYYFVRKWTKGATKAS